VDVVAGVEVGKEVLVSVVVVEEDCQGGEGNEKLGEEGLEVDFLEGGLEIAGGQMREGRVKQSDGIGGKEEDAGGFGKLSQGAEEAGQEIFAVKEVVKTGKESKDKQGFGGADGVDDEISGRENEGKEREGESQFFEIEADEELIEEDNGEDGEELGDGKESVGVAEEGGKGSGEERIGGPVSRIVFGGERELKLSVYGLGLVEGFGGDDVVGAVVVGDDGGHALLGERNAPEGGEAEEKGGPD